MIITFQHLALLKFPLYPLPSDNWHRQDGVTFLEHQVLDETNMPGETLGIRRLQCGRRDLFPLKKAVTSIEALIKCKRKYFIDSSGRTFIYTKSYKSKLSSYRISKIERKGTASILWVQGCNHPFQVPRPPPVEYPWVSILHYDKVPHLVYEFTKEPIKSTRRLI